MADASTEIGQVNIVKAAGHKESNTDILHHSCRKKREKVNISLWLTAVMRLAIVLYLLHQDCNSLNDKKH